MAFSDGSMSPADIAAVTGNGSNNSWGGDGSFWIIVLFLIAILGFGNGFGGNYGGGGAAGAPYVVADVQRGFDHNGVINGLNSISSAITDGVVGTQTALCNGFAGVNANMTAGFANAETAANARQIANMQQGFAMQTATTAGMNGLAMGLQNAVSENRAGISDLKYTVATENCADRQALNEGVRDIIANQTAGIQQILDKLCDQELQAERRENQNLRSELMYARGQASQIEQTAQILQGQNQEVDALYNRLSNCPVPSTPVYGRTPIFTCNNNNPYGYGCACGMA